MQCKTCSKCGEAKDIECFGINRSNKDGRSYMCKECRNKHYREQRLANSIPARYEDVGMGKKRCPKCNEIKNVECFKISHRTKDGRRIYCIECRREKERDYRIAKGIPPLVRVEVKDGKKLCTKCGEIKKVEYFGKNPGTSSGFGSWCKKCVNESKRGQRRDSGIISRRILGGGAETGKKQCPTCGEVKEISCFGKRAGRPDGLSSQCKGCMRKYQIATKDRRNKHNIERCKHDENFRLTKNLRGRVQSAMKGKGKNASTMDLIGCSLESLWLHLEGQFSEGMTRNNHGAKGWHVDHIVPCASFDLTDPEQQKICFHYTNLQPLWAKDNLRKSTKLPHEYNENKEAIL